MTRRLLCAGICLVGPSLACGGSAEHDAAQEGEPYALSEPGPVSISSQADASCVSLPPLPPRLPQRSYAESCAVTSFVPGADAMSGVSDARALLVGRWQLCGEPALYGEHSHAGIEFGSNGRNQLLRVRNGDLLVPLSDTQGTYFFSSSGQLLQRGELILNEPAAVLKFDASGDALQLELPEQGRALRYARVAPDLESAAANRFSTSALGCSMVGVWDTVQGSKNPAAAFAFNERGEWFGGAWGSDLCAAHSMYGTYNLVAPAVIQDNFDLLDVRFELVSNVGAGACEYWRGAGFLPQFSDDCSRVELESTWDNCAGGRGYLSSPGEVLLRRSP
jgi:hypothetical protein